MWLAGQWTDYELLDCGRGEKLERRTGLPVVMWDERLTTVAADKAMIEAGIRRERRKDYVDKIAAALILQGYLDRRSHGQTEKED